VNKFLTRYFMQYVDYAFTARLEDELDQISRGEKEWVPLLQDFWTPFKTLIETTEETVQRKDVTQEALDETCPKCGKTLSIRLGKRGRFIGCSGYPECDYTRNMEGEVTTVSEPEVVQGRLCPDCGHSLHIKIGRYGKFIGCGNYPKCKHIEPLEKPADTGIECPECHKGTLLKRKSRYGKIFFSCSTYPTCTYAVWNEPIEQACPSCAWPVMTIKTTKRRGTEKVCPRKDSDLLYKTHERSGGQLTHQEVVLIYKNQIEEKKKIDTSHGFGMCLFLKGKLVYSLFSFYFYHFTLVGKGSIGNLA